MRTVGTARCGGPGKEDALHWMLSLGARGLLLSLPQGRQSKVGPINSAGTNQELSNNMPNFHSYKNNVYLVKDAVLISNF